MRQRLFAALLILSLLPAGCGAGGDAKRAEAFRAKLEAASVVCEAEVTAVSERETGTFTLSCAESAQGAEIAVLKPELLRGVTAHTEAGSASLAFDGIVIPVPTAPGDVSPLLGLPLLLEALRDGCLDLVWREGDRLTAQYLLDDELAVRVYFAAEMCPADAEIISAGRRAVTLHITKWEQTEKEASYEQNDPDMGGDQSQHPGA